jgi:hypothetical protein
MGALGKMMSWSISHDVLLHGSVGENDVWSGFEEVIIEAGVCASDYSRVDYHLMIHAY